MNNLNSSKTLKSETGPDTEEPDTESDSSCMSKTSFILLGAIFITLSATIATFLYARNSSSGGYFIIVLLYALLFVASYSDAAFRRISNSFNYTALILSLLLMMVICPLCEIMGWTSILEWIGANNGSGWGGIALESLLGFALCLLIGIISFAVNGLGGGDAKLLLTVGVLAGFNLTISILANTLIIALAIGILNLISNGILIRTLQKALIKLYETLTRQTAKEPIIFSRNESPFSLSVFLGLLLLPFINMNSFISNFQW